jgi:hypothetical protein
MITLYATHIPCNSCAWYDTNTYQAILLHLNHIVGSPARFRAAPIGGKMLNRRFALIALCALLFPSRMMLGQAAQSAPAARASSRTISDEEMQIMRSDVRERRKKLTAANMTLTPEEASNFWPLYDQYIQETIKINDQRWALIQKYAANYSTMSDELAQDYITQSSDVDQQLIALRMKYVPIFQKVISIKKTAQWYQVDRRLELMISTEMGSLTPVVSDTK